MPSTTAAAPAVPAAVPGPEGVRRRRGEYATGPINLPGFDQVQKDFDSKILGLSNGPPQRPQVASLRHACRRTESDVRRPQARHADRSSTRRRRPSASPVGRLRGRAAAIRGRATGAAARAGCSITPLVTGCSAPACFLVSSRSLDGALRQLHPLGRPSSPFAGGQNAAASGCDNYTRLFTAGRPDPPELRQSIRNNFYFVLLRRAAADRVWRSSSRCCVNNRFLKGKSFFRTAFFFPSVTSRSRSAGVPVPVRQRRRDQRRC